MNACLGCCKLPPSRKWIWIEPSLKAHQFILAGPGVNRIGKIDRRPVELVDVVPTLLDAAGMDSPDRLAGLSLLRDDCRNGAFAEMHGRGYEEYQHGPAVMYRTADWKLILSQQTNLGESTGQLDQTIGELYHLTEDPLELGNLFSGPTYATIREDMTRKLLMHVMCNLGRVPGGDSRAKIRVTGPETMPDASNWPG